MDELLFRKIESEQDLENHDCGVGSIDQMVRNSYMQHLLGQQDTYKIVFDGKIIGFYAIQIRALNFDNSDAEFAQYYDGDPIFGYVYIRYLCVDKNAQGYGVGTTALEYIVKKMREEHERLPVRLIVFDALREKAEFYEKRGFSYVRSTDRDKVSEKVEMFLDLMPEERNKEAFKYFDKQLA